MGHIFISYSHKDTKYAHALADHLKNIGFDVWIDERLDYGSQWPYEIQKQLDSCDAFLLVMTPRAFASDWVQSELQRAKRKRKPIFPLLLEGEEPWLSVESTQYYDVRGETLPDTRFYSAIQRAVSTSHHTTTPDQLPKNIAKTDKPAPKMQRELLIAIVGGCAAVIVSSWGLFHSVLSPSATPSPVYFPTETVPFTFISTTDSTPSPSAGNNSSPSVQLPDGATVMMVDSTGNKYQYTISSAQLEPLPPDKYLLRLQVHMWTNYPYPTNFWGNSFRLYVGDVHLKPSNSLDELISQEETKEGNVEFEVDVSLKGAILVQHRWTFLRTQKSCVWLFPDRLTKLSA
jgi:hypothetical protein